MAKNFFSENADIQFYVNEHIDWKSVLDLKEDFYKNPSGETDAPATFEEALDVTKTVLEFLGKLVGDVIAPNAPGVDREGVRFDAQRKTAILPPGIEADLKQLGESGYFGISLPRRYGGLNSTQIATVIASELLGAGDAGLMTIACLQWGVANVLWHFADESLKEKYLPKLACGQYGAAMVLTEAGAGSDLGRITTSATPDEKSGQWRIKGTKQFITNGHREALLVLARSDQSLSGDVRGLSLFLVEGKDVQVTRVEEKLGIHGTAACELVFNDAPGLLIGKAGYGLVKYMFALMNEARLGVAAQGLGIAQAAYDGALQYAGEREQFGRLLRDLPPVAEMLVRMKLQIEALRALIYRTAWFVDMYSELDRHLEGVKAQIKSAGEAEKESLKKKRDEMLALSRQYRRYAEVLTPLAKLRSGRACVEVADTAVQVLGGYGYIRDFSAERHYRDARIVDLYEGTGQMQAKAAISGVLNRCLDPLAQEIILKAKSKASAELLEGFQKAWKIFGEAVDHVQSRQSAPDYETLLSLCEGPLCQIAAQALCGGLLLEQSLISQRKQIVARRYLAWLLPQVRMLADGILAENMDTMKHFSELTR